MYSPEERQAVQSYLLAIAQADERITDGAMVGSESIGAHDQWSDIDLTFGVQEDASIPAILTDWTAKIQAQYDAAHLFDLPWQNSIYRVFLLPNCLQVDISFTPSSGFGATTPNFKLLFGQAKPRAQKKAPELQVTFGYAVHHALRARFSIERQRFWQAAYWISACRDYALKIACLKHQLNPFDARGYDDLPPSITQALAPSLAIQLNETPLRQALSIVVTELISIVKSIPELKMEVESQLKWIGDLE